MQLEFIWEGGGERGGNSRELNEKHFHPSFKTNELSILSDQGPVVQSVVSLTSSLRVKILTVLARTVSNSQALIFAEKNVSAKATHIFSAKILAYMAYLMIKVLRIC